MVQNIRKISRHNCIGHGEYTLYIGFECMTEDCYCTFGTEDYAEREEEILESAIRKWNLHKFRKLGENAHIVK